MCEIGLGNWEGCNAIDERIARGCSNDGGAKSIRDHFTVNSLAGSTHCQYI